MKQAIVGALIAVGLFACVQLARAETKSPAHEPTTVGRWQIVHGAPSALYRTYLIDTVTGDSYIACDVDRHEGWCRLARSENLGVSSTRPPAAVDGVAGKHMPPGW